MTFCQTDFQQDTIDLMVYKHQNFIPHTLKGGGALSCTAFSLSHSDAAFLTLP